MIARPTDQPFHYGRDDKQSAKQKKKKDHKTSKVGRARIQIWSLQDKTLWSKQIAPQFFNYHMLASSEVV